jgi:glyoxylase-like metal-dependent hydrolase (beta-lactamase superfamily II)
MPVTRIHPRVFQIAAPFENGGLVHCYLVDAPRRALIDTGTASVPQASLLPALAELGWDPSALRTIINTHVHIDHAGGNAEMQEASGAGIQIHRADAVFTDREQYLERFCRDSLRVMGDHDQIPHAEAVQRQLLGREWGVERTLEEGDEVDLGDDVRFQVLHTPGHTPGSASFYWEKERLLFSGDAVNGRGSRAGGFPLYFSVGDYTRSLNRLLDVDIATLAQAHRYRWSGTHLDAVRTGADVRRTLEDSLAAAQAIDAAVRAELDAQPGLQPRDLVPRVIRAAAPALGNDPDAETIPASAISTIIAHWREARSGR